MQELILPEGTTMKGLVCLVYWRAAHGQLDGKIKISNEEVHDIVKCFGVNIPVHLIGATVESLIKGSFVSVHRAPEGPAQISTFKVTAKCKNAAALTARALGTELLPPSPKYLPQQFDIEEEVQVMPKESETAITPKILIDGFMDILALASEAGQLKERIAILEAQSSEIDQAAIAEAIRVLMVLDGLQTSPTGMLLQEKHPGLVTGAMKLAQRLGGK